MSQARPTLRPVAAVVLSIVLASGGLANDLELHFLDVDQGDATLIKCPNGLTVLVDCGSLRPSLTTKERVREHLLENLVGPRVDVVVITHPDTDHYRFLPDVLEGIDIGLLLYVGIPGEYSTSNVGSWIESIPNRMALDVSDANLQNEPSQLFDSGDVQFHILAANVSASQSPKNARSIVLRVDLNDFKAILTGDATFATEDDIGLRYDPEFLDVELLKIGHHGSSTTSTSDAWAQLVRPNAAVVSAGFDNSFGHPRRLVIDRLALFTDNHAPPHYMRWGVTDGSRTGPAEEPEAIDPTAYWRTGVLAPPPIELGRHVIVDITARQVEGEFGGVTAEGWLIVSEAEGGITYVHSDTIEIRVPSEND